MAQIRTVTLVSIDKAVVTVWKDGGDYRATLTAKRHSWTGVSKKSVVAAIKEAIKAVENEKRTFEKGRPGDRYRIARSLAR